MTEDEISEEGRRARFEQWEKLGLDRVKADLINGGHQLIGGPPSVRNLAWEWVRMREAPPPTVGRRDKELIRKLLLMFEAAGTDRGFSFEAAEAETLGRTLTDIRYNLQQAEDMGLLEVFSKPLNGEWTIRRITARGHDFLETANQLSTPTSAPDATANVAVANHPKPPEILTLKPTLWGIGIDLKEVWRRAQQWWQRKSK